MQVNASSTHARMSQAGLPAGELANGSIDDWRLQALCAQADAAQFFPDKGQSPLAALKICADCPVRVECLNFAMENDERFGVWGGMTERGRRQLRRERQEAADGQARVSGLTARGNDTWAVQARYRRPDGTRQQLATTVRGDREAALRRLAEIRTRAEQLAAGAPLLESEVV